MSMQLHENRQAGAAPERWEPLGDLELATERMRRLLEQTFGQLPSTVGWTPLVDIEERDDAYVVEAELPGAKREDVSIELVGNELVVSGEIKERERTGILRRSTRRVGAFEYRVALPQNVDRDGIDAKLDDGVLTVRIPKVEQAQRRRIDVQSS
jgi:HSP20 family protein